MSASDRSGRGGSRRLALWQRCCLDAPSANVGPLAGIADAVVCFPEAKKSWEDSMPCRRARLELTADATLETISRSRPVRDASDHAACLCFRHDDLAPAASAPEGRALRRQGASAWRAGGVACRDRGGRRRFFARAWVVALACQKPKDLGYAEELWTMKLLSQHAELRKAS